MVGRVRGEREVWKRSTYLYVSFCRARETVDDKAQNLLQRKVLGVGTTRRR